MCKVYEKKTCSHCGQTKSCQRTSFFCSHFACEFCLREKVVDPLAQDVLQRRKVGTLKVKCLQEDCKQLFTRELL